MEILVSEESTVRIILKRCRTGGHGELLTEEYKTVAISSETIEKLLVGERFFGAFSVIGAELIDSDASREKFDKDDTSWADAENDE